MSASTQRYELISSPMMLNEVLKQRMFETLTCYDQHMSGYLKPSEFIEPRRSKSVEGKGYTRTTTALLEGRGYTRTATTLLDWSATKDELDRYNKASGEVRKHDVKEDLPRLTSETRRFCVSKSPLNHMHNSNQVSVYSGPLHNNRPMMDLDSGPSLADKLANARMMSKSGYSWDQNATCARIRLGDGAILQNLYPSHSHVKLRSGKIERIDAYTQRFLNDRELLKEVTLIKEYEYNQWSRTKPLNMRDYNQNTKPIPVEKIESRYTQPSWDTLRAMNSTTTLSMKHHLFSYDDLAAKFTEPKFLKRMGFTNKGSHDKQIGGKHSIKEAKRTNDINEPDFEQPAENEEQQNDDEEQNDDMDDDISDRLSSDDEEYYQTELNPLDEVPPERIPSSKRSTRQQLAIYKDDGVIGSKSIINRHNAHQNLEPIENPVELTAREQNRMVDSERKPVVPVSTLEMERGVETKAEQPSSKLKNIYPAKSVRKSKSYKLDISTTSTHRRFVPFTEPVCLCPKLSKETLASFYSPMMQHYFASTSSNRHTKCKLHGPNAQERDKSVLKSL